ncbi:S-layer homology domain-containing protein [Paenibacillus sp. S150]|uniref:S-layer homology domain-containing protein n=1 Tax=Paenibacillus sp. S150 TaxID=2749826 RepID=UPI001C5A33D4|nr:S-layer homology domain-containing protein [Paenibacillus sp. S150]MBW4081651.1 S-layer homology domain-containing protein [Paenibacillus sp. S150]
MKKTWRGLMTGILGASMLLGTLGGVSAAPVPKDIQGHWAQAQLQDWLNKGYLGGYPDGTVQPNKAITRGEYVALINRLFGFTDTGSVSFTDVKSNSWVYSEVAKAVKAGYIGGYENNTFRPANALTRQEAAVIAAKVLSLNTASASTAFKDNAQISAWAKGAVAAAADKKIINGYPDGTFGPKRSLTRAEAVGIISNSVVFKPSNPGGTVTPTPTPAATPAPTASATPTPTPTPVTGGGGGVITAPTVSGLTYGHVGSVTADVYLTPSVTGAVYYVVAPYSSSAALPSAAQVQAGVTSTGTAGVNYGTTAASAGTIAAFSIYGLSADTEYAAYIAVVDTAGNWSAVSSLLLTTAPSSTTSITLVEPGQPGTVTADVYVTYGQAGGPAAPVRYVVLPASSADPTAVQIADGQDSSGTQLTAPWTGWITPAPSPAVRQTLSLTGLTANTSYKVYLITGSGSIWSPVEILRIQTK